MFKNIELATRYGNLTPNSILTCFSLLLLLSFLLVSSIQTNNNLIAAVDVDTKGDGRAAAFDGEESISTDGDSFCGITNDIAGGKFSSLFEGIVDCDNNNNLQISNQFLVEYSYTKNPVKIGEKTYFTITVNDRNTGNPISDAFVKLAVDDTSSSLRDNTAFAAAAAAAGGGGSISSNQDYIIEDDTTTQTTYTDSNGHATFTVQLGPKSDTGIYDTEIEVKKDNYQSSFEQTDLRVI
jgi:hypothetical protein